MKAAVLFGIKDLRLCEKELPDLGDDDVVLKVKSAALCGTDIRMWANGIPDGTQRVLGHEMSGIIEKTGKNVTGYKKGDKVSVAPNMGCGVCDFCVSGNTHMCPDYKAHGINIDGAFAEYVLIPAEAVRQGNICHLGGSISFEEAAVVEALSCVYNGFEALKIRPGDTVLIIGAGPIGVMHAKLAEMAGASRIIVNDFSAERLELCKKVNNKLITYNGDNLRGWVMDLTNGKGVDVCITACPSPQAQANSLELMAVGGRINFFGGLPKGKESVTLNTNIIHYKQLIVTGTARANLSQYRKCLSLVNDGVLDIKGLITNRFTLDEINDAFSFAASAGGIKSVIMFE